MTTRRIGVFGGAFDPPHVAHAELGRAALTQFQLDELRIFPTGQAWHKTRELTPVEHRVEMTRLAFAELPKVVVDARETDRSGATYTIDTLEALQREWPDAHWWLFIGTDQAERFTSWHRWQDILRRATLVVADRLEPSSQAAHRQWQNALPDSVQTLEWRPIDLSATLIRQTLTSGGDASAWLQPQVYQYIRQHHLYSDNHE